MEMITFETRNGIIWVDPSEICLVESPCLLDYLTFRGYGSFITLKCGRIIHVKPEASDISEIISESTTTGEV